MKALIEREVRRRELTDNIKLGDGGIREIEFIVQSFQLIRGGQDRRLQHSSLRHALPLLAGAKLLPAEAVAQLGAAYGFLRRVEDRLQVRADQQVHRPPHDERERASLALSMGYARWVELQVEIDRHRGIVAAHFQHLVFGSASVAAESAAPLALGSSALGTARSGEQLTGLQERLRAARFEPAADGARLLADFLQAAWIARLDEVS